MAGVKIPIEADIASLEKKLDGLTRKIDKINRIKWSPVDPGAVERDARKVEDVIVAAARRTTSRTGGGGGGGEFRVRQRYTYAPDFGDIPRAAGSAVGGGFGQVAGYAARGARAGAAEGGGGGGLGLLRGGLIGAAVAGIFKLGQSISEGTDMARERGATLDTLKRQMGDVGISFAKLKIASESAAYSLGINSKDFAIVEARLNAAGRGSDRTPGALADSANVVSGFARSYGMDPGAAAGLFGGVRNVNQKQSYREFAVILAETIEKSSMSSNADQVAQALVSFSAVTSRIAMALPNISGYAGAYSGLMASGTAGMTPDAAAAILGQANSATAGMGAAGEAGQAFTLAAVQHSGMRLNPLEAMSMAGGGLFGTRGGAFGPSSAMGMYLGADSAKLAGGAGSDLTMFQLLRGQTDRVVGRNDAVGKELKAEMMQRYFGLQSINQAAALMNLDPSTNMGGIGKSLEAAGVDLKNVNYTNIATVAKISNAKGRGDLDAIYGDMKGRTGSSALDSTDIASIEAAKKSGKLDDYQSALIKASSQKDYAQDTYTVARDSKVVLEDIKTSIGETLYGKLDEFQSDVVSLLGGRKQLDANKILNADYDYQAGVDDAKFKHDAADERIRAMQGGSMQHWQELNANDKAFHDELAGLKATHEAAIHVHVYLDKDGHVKDQTPNKATIPVPRSAGVN